MKKVVLALLVILIAVVPISFGEEGEIEEYILVQLIDGSVEKRPISMYLSNKGLSLRMAESISSIDEAIINAEKSPEIRHASINQRIYLTETPTNFEVTDLWRFDFMEMTENWDQILNIPYGPGEIFTL